MNVRSKYLYAALALFVVAPGCGDNPVSAEAVAEALTQTLETQNITFRFATGDSVDSAWQQSFHEWITQMFGVQLSGKLRYNKYRDRAQIQSVTGNNTNGFAEPETNTVHTIWPRDGHEAIHVYSALVGRPSDFFNEGIAVALNSEPFVQPLAPPWNGQHVHTFTKNQCDNAQCPALPSILTTDDFRDRSEAITYPVAGSFMLYLIEQHGGIGPVLQFFGAGSRDQSRAAIESNFQAAWGMSVAEAEAAWRAFLDTWTG